MKNKKQILKFLGFSILPIIPATTILTSCGNAALNAFIAKLEKANNLQTILKLSLVNDQSQTYSLYCHNDSIKSFIKDSYKQRSQFDSIYESTESVRTIATFSNKYGTFIKASDNEGSSTNYDQIWVRDSMWAYKKLINDDTEESKTIAKNVLLTLLDYYSTPKQIARATAAINNPSLVLLSKDGYMNAVHIRFDASALDDVQVDGADELWNHKQNDALGFLLSEVIVALENKDITFNDLNQTNTEIEGATKRIDTLIYLVTYLNALNFYQMADSGAWEENEAVRASSIGLVTNGEERLYEYMSSTTPDTDRDEFITAYNEFINVNNYQHYCEQDRLSFYIDAGYKAIKTLINNGGECTGYDKFDPNYRTADAALLNLIYPCTLNNFDSTYQMKILQIVNDDLVTPTGIKRYKDDTYQSANYWFLVNTTGIDDSETAAKRKKEFIPGTEASWFFDSWFALCSFKLMNDESVPSPDKLLLENNLYKFLNRSIGQITQANNYVADGDTVTNMGLPESYNIIYKNNNNFWYIASSIDDLNWARSMFSILLETLDRNF